MYSQNWASKLFSILYKVYYMSLHEKYSHAKSFHIDNSCCARDTIFNSTSLSDDLPLICSERWFFSQITSSRFARNGICMFANKMRHIFAYGTNSTLLLIYIRYDSFVCTEYHKWRICLKTNICTICKIAIYLHMVQMYSFIHTHDSWAI